MNNTLVSYLHLKLEWWITKSSVDYDIIIKGENKMSSNLYINECYSDSSEEACLLKSLTHIIPRKKMSNSGVVFPLYQPINMSYIVSINWFMQQPTSKYVQLQLHLEWKPTIRFQYDFQTLSSIQITHLVSTRNVLQRVLSSELRTDEHLT